MPDLKAYAHRHLPVHELTYIPSREVMGYIDDSRRRCGVRYTAKIDFDPAY